MAQNRTLADRLIYAYVKNHKQGVVNRVIGLWLVCMFYYLLYGFPSGGKGGTLFIFFYAGGIFYALQQNIYTKILKNGRASRRQLALTCCNKIIYTGFFLAGLFYPFRSHIFYDHIVGYFTALSVIFFSMTLSSAFLPLFFVDIFVSSVFILVMAYINFDVQETRYMIPLLGATILLSVMTARILNRGTKSLLQKSQELALAVAEANAAKEAKALFLATMSHEIRTPLNGITGMIRDLQTMKLNKEQAQCVSIIESCSKTLLNTLNDVLDLSKMEAGKFNIHAIDFNFHETLAGIQSLMGARAREKKLSLILDIDDKVPNFIHADPNRLHQIVTNLVSNAIKFTDKGYVAIRVKLLRQAPCILHIEVEDTGIGITAEAQKKLFSNYVQAEPGTAAKYGGTGLGLSIARQLAGLMGGQMGLQSVAGKGSVFWLEIPCIKAAKPVSILETMNAAASLPTGKNLLAVEDNAVNRKVLQALLSIVGLDADYASNGAEAVKMAGEKHYDLILMDMEMPVMDGMAATRAIRLLNDRYRHVPIIALTGHDDESKMKDGRMAGMTDHIAKPIDSNLLNEKLHLYLNKAQNVEIFRLRSI